MSRLRPVVAVVLTMGILSVGAFTFVASHTPKSHFCKASAAIVQHDGQSAWFQDQGDAGRDGCDMADSFSERGPKDGSALVLGFDCKFREPGGRVTATTAPNRADGTCGQPDPPRPAN